MSMMEAALSGKMRERVFTKADLVRELVPRFNRQVRGVLDHETCLRIRTVLAGGSGDSICAPLAAEMAFEAIARLPTEAVRGLHMGRYTAAWLPAGQAVQCLAIGVSVSGEVARTVEAVKLARAQGAVTLALTAGKQSRITEAAEFVFDTTVSDRDAPGLRTYIASLMGLYMVALRLAEVRETISQPEGDAWRRAMLSVADVIEATNERVSEPVRQAAKDLKDRQAYIFVGGGPAYAMALFGASKMVEAVGCHTWAQDVEEWAHLERFSSEQGTPNILIAPPGASYGRALEMARIMKRTGKHLIAVVEEGEQEISAIADDTWPVMGHVPEPLTPLVYSSALEMFVSDVAQERGEPYFRNFAAPWRVEGISDTHDGRIIDSVDEIRGAAELP